ncbi:unnamed protein product, partial [Ixodes hexagonus]
DADQPSGPNGHRRRRLRRACVPERKRQLASPGTSSALGGLRETARLRSGRGRARGVAGGRKLVVVDHEGEPYERRCARRCGPAVAGEPRPCVHDVRFPVGTAARSACPWAWIQ